MQFKGHIGLNMQGLKIFDKVKATVGEENNLNNILVTEGDKQCDIESASGLCLLKLRK